MSFSKTLINETPEWAMLNLHQKSTNHLKMRNFFADNPHRFDEMSEVLGGFLFDYSKNRITEETFLYCCNYLLWLIYQDKCTK